MNNIIRSLTTPKGQYVLNQSMLSKIDQVLSIDFLRSNISLEFSNLTLFGLDTISQLYLLDIIRFFFIFQNKLFPYFSNILKQLFNFK